MLYKIPGWVVAPLDARENITIELSPSLARVDPVFHVSKVEPFIENDLVAFPGRPQEALVPVVNAAGDYEAALESILDMRWHQGKVQICWVSDF